MNINDIDTKEVPTLPNHDTAWIEAIFKRQKHLHDKYKPIEHASGIGLAIIQDVPFSLDDKRWQYVLKDYAWRVTEELAEAGEAVLEGNPDHHIEELIDALHFYTELMIMTGYDTVVIKMSSSSVGKFHVVQSLGLAMNCLKQKPWKQHHFQTDMTLFYGHIHC